jgi:precorrin-3B synthase
VTSLGLPTPPLRRGACPGVVDAMSSGDGWLLRVRLPGGLVTAAQLRVLADVSSRSGSGLVEITSRGNLQLRGVPERAVEAAADALVAAALAAADPDDDARRAVVASPLAGHDPNEVADVAELLTSVVAALAAADLPGRLPAKFGVVIDGGGDPSVRAVPGDVCLGAIADGSEIAWQVSFGGPLTASPAWLGAIDDGALVALVVEVATRCATHQTRAAALDLTDLLPTAAPGSAKARSNAAVGVVGNRVVGRCNVVAERFLGRVSADDLRTLADISDRTDPRRAVVRATTSGIALAGVPRPMSEGILARLAADGWIIDADDPRRGISACIGAPGCDSARADTTAPAAALARRARSRHVHLAACEKRCGAPADALVLVADDGGRFDLEAASW